MTRRLNFHLKSGCLQSMTESYKRRFPWDLSISERLWRLLVEHSTIRVLAITVNATTTVAKNIDDQIDWDSSTVDDNLLLFPKIPLKDCAIH